MGSRERRETDEVQCDFGSGLPLSVDLSTEGGSTIEGFLLFDENLNCVSINSAVERLFRVSEKEVLGKSILEVVPGGDREAAYQNYTRAMSGGGATVEHSEVGDLRLSIKAFKVGKGLGVILSEAPDGQRHSDSACTSDQRLDLAGRLAALGDLVGSVGRELDVMAGEQAAFDGIASNGRKGNGSDGDACSSSIHTRELSGYLREFNKAMSQFVGAKDIAELEEAYLQMARTLALMAEMREPYARGHAERVSLLSNDIAVWLGCTGPQIREIQMAAILHDIGKVAIPDKILFKPGQLTTDEYNEVKRHPGASVEILSNLNCFDPIIPIVANHHEWYNGMGYPNKLRADEISLGARVLSVADAYDAMTSPRPHRSRMNNREAVEIIRNGAGTQWDPMIVHAFLQIVGDDDSTTEDEETPAENGQVELVLDAGDDSRKTATREAVESKTEILTRAEEALERAKHWAHWMESMQQRAGGENQEADG